MSRRRTALFWIALTLAVAVPLGAALLSPLLAWRDPTYIAAGFAGVIAMVIMLFQPLLAAGYLPSISVVQGRRVHRWVGSILLLSVLVHVGGLWITSPPDVIDALLFNSPTPFSLWGVIAMWGVFGAACLAALRSRFRLRPRTWRISHKSLAALIVVSSVIHAMLIEGTMEIFSKAILCLLVLIATALALIDFNPRK